MSHYLGGREKRWFDKYSKQNLVDGLKLCIGMKLNIPWQDVEVRDLEGYIKRAAILAKKGKSNG